MSTLIKARSPYHIRTQNLVSEPVLFNLTCQDITITGFQVDDEGAITTPTAKINDTQVSLTIDSTLPTSFETTNETTPRSLYCTMTVPSGYKNTGQEIECVTTAIQQRQAVVLQCKTMRIINNASVSRVYRYNDCGNETRDVTVAAGAQNFEDVCTHPLSYPQPIDAEANTTISFQSYGCTLFSDIYILDSNIWGAYDSKQAAIDAATEENPSNPLFKTPPFFRDAYPQTPENGLRPGTLVSTRRTDDGLYGVLVDGWYGSFRVISGTKTHYAFRTVDSIIAEGGMINDGTVL